MNEQEIIQQLHSIPPERWDDVLTFMRSLHPISPNPGGKGQVLTAASLLNSGLIGMWEGRADIDNDHQFARRLREQAQVRGWDK